MQDVFPDVVRPISAQPERDECVAIGPSRDEILWLTVPKAASEGLRATTNDAGTLHGYRNGPQAISQPYRLPRRPHFVQRTRDGFLFADARAVGGAPNAWTTDQSLQDERRLALGDGLSDVRVSPAGSIWTAYFDEGPLGSGLGSPGVVKFDRRGREVWGYDASKAGTDDVVDVYAFNLAAEDDAWVYFYTPFAIVRWLEGTPTVWQTNVEGAKAIAVRPDRALLFGDYDDATVLRILDLPRGGGRALLKKRLRLSLPEGADPRSILAFGAAHRLILSSGAKVMILENW